MADAPKETFATKIRNAIPLLVILGAFIWASAAIATRRVETYPKDALVIRMGHWQLEDKLRPTLEEMAREFENDPHTQEKYKGRPIRVVQVPVGDPTYGQWITCQMMGGTAPDICELGLAVLPEPTWIRFETRYFEPLTELALNPNPYNKVRQSDLDELAAQKLPEAEFKRQRDILYDFERSPLSQTYTDAMVGGYREELQEFTRIPLSRFTTRVFYNKTLYKKLMGKETPAEDFCGFLEECEKISKIKYDAKETYSPIAAAGGFHIWMWNSGMLDPMTFSMVAYTDFNRDGKVGPDETYAAWKSGRISFDTPAMKSKFKMSSMLMKHFQTGFTGVSRDEAVMKFAKQQAVFISTGTWDMGSLVKMAEGQFEIGIMAFPQPRPDDPEFGNLVLGPFYSKPDQGFAFGVSRNSANPEVAKDFLLFMASRRANQKLNHAIGWLPSLRDVPLPEMLGKFNTAGKGMNFGQDMLNLGGDSRLLLDQQYTQFQNNSGETNFTPEESYKRYVAGVGSGYLDKGLTDWENKQKDWRQAVLNNERMLAVIRGQALLDGASAEDPLWVRYRAYTTNRQVMPEVIRAEQAKIVRDKPLRDTNPYQFSELAKKNIASKYAILDPGPAPAPGGHTSGGVPK